MTPESRPNPIPIDLKEEMVVEGVKETMERIAQRKPGRRFLKYDRATKSIVSVCNPVICRDPHEKHEFDAEGEIDDNF